MSKRRPVCMLPYPKTLRAVYYGMTARCYDPKHKNYKHYGARGILICDDWKNNHGNFYVWAMRNGYKEGLRIDRINPDLGYSPDNCQFVTHQENIQTRRSITKLNPDKVRQIRKDFDLMTTRKVAKKWGLSHHHIIDIKLKRAWSNVE